MTIDEFANKIRKPLFVYTMAVGYENQDAGSKTRCDNARQDMTNLIAEFVGVPADATFDKGTYDS